MKRSQFAERQYEAAAHIELASGQAGPFVPTQPIETFLAIDAAVDPPSTHAIWQILNVHIPRRVHLSPHLWPELPPQFHNQIPGRFCSLFLQFKRPVFQDNKRAKHYSRIRGNYFEVNISPGQQRKLLALQNRLRPKAAIVRYASPAFWSWEDFLRHDERREVLANSAFITPSRVKAHRKWIYAGASGTVLLNPEPEDAPGEDWKAVIAEMTSLATQESLLEHVQSIAEALTEDGESTETGVDNALLRRIDQYGKFSSDDHSFLINLSIVAREASETDATWVVLLLPDDAWRKRITQWREWTDYVWFRWWRRREEG